MKQFKKVIFFFLALLPLACECELICGSSEEGLSHHVQCRGKAKRNWTMLLFDETRWVAVSFCNITGNFCDIYYSDLFFNVIMNNVSNTLYIRSLNKTAATFLCKIDGIFDSECEVETFVNPVRPTCDDPTLSKDRETLSIKCMTPLVYPSAVCIFQIRGEKAPETIEAGDVTYTNNKSVISSLNKEVTCTLTLPVATLARQYYQFRVLMRANSSYTINRQPYNIESEYTQIFATAFGEKGGWIWILQPNNPYAFSVPMQSTLREGLAGRFYCYYPVDFARESVSLQLYEKATWLTVADCPKSSIINCESPPNLKESYIIDIATEMDTLVMSIVTRIGRQRNVFRCVANGNIVVSSFKLDVFEPPAAPFCDPAYFTSDKKFVVVTCRTASVYKSARCSFIESQEKYKVQGEILYQDSPSSVVSGNRATTCSIFIHASKLPNGTYHYKVFMSADLNTALYFNERIEVESSNTVEIVVGDA